MAALQKPKNNNYMKDYLIYLFTLKTIDGELTLSDMTCEHYKKIEEIVKINVYKVNSTEKGRKELIDNLRDEVLNYTNDFIERLTAMLCNYRNAGIRIDRIRFSYEYAICCELKKVYETETAKKQQYLKKVSITEINSDGEDSSDDEDFLENLKSDENKKTNECSECNAQNEQHIPYKLPRSNHFGSVDFNKYRDEKDEQSFDV